MTKKKNEKKASISSKGKVEKDVKADKSLSKKDSQGVSSKKKNATKIVGKQERLKTPEAESSDEMKKLLIIVLVVVGIVVLFYIITGLKTGDVKLPKSDKPAEVTIQYEKILGGETFNQAPDEYLVVFYDSTTSDASRLSQAITTYKAKNKLSVYTVDLNDPFNEAIVSAESNSEASVADELSISEPTMIKVQKGKNASYITGTSTIEDKLTNA